MVDYQECLKARSKILALQSLDNSDMILASLHHGIRIFDPVTYDNKHHLITKGVGSQTKSLTLSPDGKLLAFCNKDEKEIHLIDIPTKRALKSIKTSEPIDLVSFTHDSEHIIAGSSQGRIYKYKPTSSTTLSRLGSFLSRSRRSYVSAFALHKHFLAAAGYGNKIFLINLHANSKHVIDLNSKARIKALLFHENTLISANVEGLIKCYDLESYEEIASIDTHLTNIKEVIAIKESSHILVNYNEADIALIDTATAKLISPRYVRFEHKVETLAYTAEKKLLVGLENGEVLHVELPTEELLHSYVIHNNLTTAYKMVEFSPYLKTSPEFQELEKQFQKTYESCADALIKQNKALALQVIEPFKAIEVKQRPIKELFRAYEEYPRLQTLYLEKNYPLAFALCNKHEPLKLTMQYKKLDEAWINNFQDAQVQLIRGRLQDAKAIFSNYATVTSKREITQFVLRHHKVFLELLQAMEKKDYHTQTRIIQKYPMFLEIPTYKQLQDTTKQKLDDTEALIQHNELKQAKQNLLELNKDPHAKIYLDPLVRKFNLMTKLGNAYKKNDFLACYELVDTSSYLTSTQLAGMLEKHWAKLLHRCEESALKGNLKGVKKILGELITLPTRSENVGSYLRVSFQIKLKQLLIKQNYKGAEGLIYTYIDVFGLDNEMKALMRQYEYMAKKKLALTQDQNKRPPRDNWLHTSIINQ